MYIYIYICVFVYRIFYARFAPGRTARCTFGEVVSAKVAMSLYMCMYRDTYTQRYVYTYLFVYLCTDIYVYIQNIYA